MAKKRDVQEDLGAVEHLIKVQSKLSAWEMDFIDSLHDRLTDGRSLSERQGDVLDEIWEAVVVHRRR